MADEWQDYYIKAGSLGKPLAKPTKIDAKTLLEWLDSEEKYARSAPIPTKSRLQALALIEVLRTKLSRHWDDANTKPGSALLEEDFRYLDLHISGASTTSTTRGMAGGSEEERAMRAAVKWMQEELSIPEEAQFALITKKLVEIAGDVKGKKLLAGELKHSASELSSLVDGRIKALKSLKSTLDRYV